MISGQIKNHIESTIGRGMAWQDALRDFYQAVAVNQPDNARGDLMSAWRFFAQKALGDTINIREADQVMLSLRDDEITRKVQDDQSAAWAKVQGYMEAHGVSEDEARRHFTEVAEATFETMEEFVSSPDRFLQEVHTLRQVDDVLGGVDWDDAPEEE